MKYLELKRKSKIKPKYKEGDKIDQLTILEYRGHCYTGKMQIRFEHIYYTECECGNRREVYQSYFNSKSISSCRQCAKDRRKGGGRKSHKVKNTSSVKDVNDVNRLWKPIK